MKKIIMIALVAAATMVAAAQRIAVLSDVHVTPGSENARQLSLAVDEINASHYDLVVMNGDLTNEGSDTELAYVKAILDSIRHPLAVMPGNHENNWSQSATKTFVDLWGADRFALVVDSLAVVGINCGPYMKMGDGHIKQEDLHWLRATLDELTGSGRRVLSFNHYPIRSGDLDNYRAYRRLLEDYPVLAHVNGHYHSWIRYDAGSIPCIMTRALKMGNDDYGYTVLEIDGDWMAVYDKPIGRKAIAKCAIGGDLKITPTPEPEPLASVQWPTEMRVDTVWIDDASIFTRLAFDADNVYFGTSLGIAKAVCKHTRRPVWTFGTESSLYSRPQVLKKGVVAVPATDGIHLLDAVTGSERRFVPTAQGPYVADGLVDGNAYYQGGYKRLERRDARSGKLVWSYDSIGNYCQAAPVADGTDVIFGAWDTWLRCIDAKTGRLRWRWNNGKSANMLGPGNVVPVVTAEHVIIVAPDRYMTCIDRATGGEIWRDNSHRYRESLGVSADGKVVYAKTMDGELVAVDALADSFSELWTVDMQLGYDHAPCVIAEAGGLVYAGSRRGIVTAVDPAARRVVWQGAVADGEINGIDIDPTDGSVWISAIDGVVCKLQVISNSE